MSDSADASVPAHGIAVVERRTGVSQHVLRAWERRYGVVTPARDSAGQRLYSEDDIEHLRLVRIVASGGRRVGQVIGLPVDELHRLANLDAREYVSDQHAAASPAAMRETAEYLNACLDAVHEMYAPSTFNALMRAAVGLGPRAFIEGVAVPLLQVVGDGWEAGILRPVTEHSLSYALRRVLTWVLDALPAPAGAPTVIFGTLPAHRHEFGALFAAIVAASRQWNVAYLGGDLPLDDIAYAASVAAASVVAVSVIGAADSHTLTQDVARLRKLIPVSVPLVLGGSAAVNNARALQKSGAIVIPDLGAWEKWLDATTNAAASNRTLNDNPETGIARSR